MKRRHIVPLFTYIIAKIQKKLVYAILPLYFLFCFARAAAYAYSKSETWRENRNLHERVSELEGKARQRELQHAKRIEEITDAYEKRHRKMSEFTDFVKRNFPYVVKLMPMINFLRERLGFNDGIIQRLCAFKDVPITGKLYSSEFNQSFEAKRSVCSIKEDENGKFDFTIGGVSHVSWFRRKRDESREAIGIPKSRQNRGIKL